MTDQAANVGTGALLAIALLLGVFASLVTAPGAEGLYGAFLAALMLAIAANDARNYRIPNELTGAAFALALLRAGAFVPDIGAEALLWPLARAAAAGLPLLLLMVLYRRWRGRDGLRPRTGSSSFPSRPAHVKRENNPMHSRRGPRYQRLTACTSDGFREAI